MSLQTKSSIVLQGSMRIAQAALLLSLACGTAMADPKTDSQEKKSKVLSIGSVAPAIDVEHWVSLGDHFNEVSKFEDGKIYVVEFWATWCGPCISSMPHLVELQHRHAKDGLQIISISDEKLDTVDKFLKRKYVSKNAPAKKKDADDDSAEEKGPATYGELTSAYCLTTDPDRSVNTDYMKAAGQNGIPTAFVVGKTGHIEWIGHPMSMDKPLEQIIADQWDRESYAKAFAKKQKTDLLMSSVASKARKGDFEGALALLSEAEAEADKTTVSRINSYRMSVQSMQIRQLSKDGEFEKAIAIADEAIKNATGTNVARWKGQKLQLMVDAGQEEEATKMLTALTSDGDPRLLNMVAWSIYEKASKSDDVSDELVAAATAAAEAAVKKEPKQATVLDTLSHLVHLSGDLDRAIQLQSQAAKNNTRSGNGIEKFLETLKKEKADQDKSE